MRNCVVPGSFDPFTLGHLDIVRRASVLFDRVYVAVMINSSKQGFFDFAARKKIAEVSCSGIPNVEVITAEGEGKVINLNMQRRSATILVDDRKTIVASWEDIIEKDGADMI